MEFLGKGGRCCSKRRSIKEPILSSVGGATDD